MLSDNHYESARDAATDLGRDEGTAAASWTFDGNTPDSAYRHVLAGIQDGDPAVLDQLATADLSGQWADGRTPDSLATDIANTVDVPREHIGSQTLDRLCDAYETAFNDAVCAEVERLALAHLA
jgi:hypothetical protein